MYGGYGPFSPHWGLGVDQIVGATVVDPNGDIVNADEALLEGIRGAGGLFGVIIDLTVKVYPLTSVSIRLEDSLNSCIKININSLASGWADHF
jgi:FAD/FMN-containing dehydrogenase